MVIIIAAEIAIVVELEAAGIVCVFSGNSVGAEGNDEMPNMRECSAGLWVKELNIIGHIR